MKMPDIHKKQICSQPRFDGLEMFEKPILLSSPMYYGDENELFAKALENGEANVSLLEEFVAKYIGVEYMAAVSSVTAAVHLALKLAAEKIYASSSAISTPTGTGREGALYGKRVFCPDFVSADIVNPILYEGGEPVFLDASDTDWGMDPEVLSMAFDTYPDVKIVIASHIYGFTAQMKQIKKICEEHGALLIEDASSSFGAKIAGQRAGSIGDYGVLGFGNSSIISAFGGGAYYSYKKADYWAHGSVGTPAWRQHAELGYDYAMSPLTAILIAGQMAHLDENIAKKKVIYEHYLERFDETLMLMNPIIEGDEPNYNMPGMFSDSGVSFFEAKSEKLYVYRDQHGAAGPMEIYDVLEAFNVESAPMYKPMHMQPVFRMYDQITLDGGIRRYEDFAQDDFILRCNRSEEMFNSGLCLPSDLRMTTEEQDKVIDIIYACYSKQDLRRW